MKCERCGKSDCTLIMSMFNTDMICNECNEKEKNHPKYNEAHNIEEKQVMNGNFNFRGIGKPSDL